MARSRIHHSFNPWQRKAVFEASLVETGEVDADPPLIILFLHQDWVGEPFWVVCLPNEVGSE